MTEPLCAVEVQGSLHRLNLRVGSGDLHGNLDGLIRRFGWEYASLIDGCFERDGRDIVSLERICEGFETENIKICLQEKRVLGNIEVGG